MKEPAPPEELSRDDPLVHGGFRGLAEDAELLSGQGLFAGRAGDMREELRVEPRDHGMLRIARWLLFPSRGWELQDAAPMLPASRYAEALAAFFSRTSAA